MLFAFAGTAKGWATVYLRLALAVGFLTAVTDRFGFWGPPGAPNVSWGDLQQFTVYAGLLNPWGMSWRRGSLRKNPSVRC
jgi:hypothetical protein